MRRETREDDETLARFGEELKIHMTGRPIDQSRELAFSYKGEECGCCMGAHIGAFFVEHPEFNVPVEEASYGDIPQVIWQESWDANMEQLTDDIIEKRNEWTDHGTPDGDKFFWDHSSSRAEFANHFYEEHINDFSMVVHFEEGVSALTRFLGLDKWDEKRYHKILARYTQTLSPWSQYSWRQPYKLSHADVLVWAYRDLLHYYEHYYERQYDAWQGWSEEMVFDRFLDDVSVKAHGVGWPLWTEDQIKEAEKWSEDEE